MHTLSMKIAIGDYERAVATLKWFQEYDAEEKSEQVIVKAEVQASSTVGAKETLETLKIVQQQFANDIRMLAINWSEQVVAEFPAKMAELLAQK